MLKQSKTILFIPHLKMTLVHLVVHLWDFVILRITMTDALCCG